MQLLVDSYARDTLHADPAQLKAARADLNQDGIDELIVVSPGCSPAAIPCRFNILADTGSTLTTLGTVAAKRLALSSNYTAGVRNIFAYQDQDNDFIYQLYVWEPEQSRYILSQ